ncbi:hypothetical protein ILYODFUR_021069, partial [Ilyodon furcidens]
MCCCSKMHSFLKQATRAGLTLSCCVSQSLAVCQLPVSAPSDSLKRAGHITANMNLFCFSLEGSIDSLYEVVQSSTDGPPLPIPSRSSSRSCSRSCSPAVLLNDNTRWRGSGRSISMDMQQTYGVNSNKKNRRTHISKSLSDNETLDNSACNTAAWQHARSREDLIHLTNNHNEEMRKPKHRTDKKGGKGGHHTGTKKKEKQQTHQSVHNNGVMTESKPAVRKNLKNGRKPGGRSGKDGSKKSHNR